MDDIKEVPDYLKLVSKVEDVGPMSYADREILAHQMGMQGYFIEQELNRLKAALAADSSEYHWRFVDEMQKILDEIKSKYNLLKNVTPEKKRWQDRVKLRLYYWAAKGRLEKEEV